MFRRPPFAVLALASATLLTLACGPADAPEGPDGQARLSPQIAVQTTDVIVALDPGLAPPEHGTAEAEARQFARTLGVEPTHLYGTALFGFAASVTDAQLRALEKNPNVARITEDGPVSVPRPPEAAQGPPDFGGGGDEGQVVPWGVDRIGGEPGEPEIGDGNDGAGVDVFIIDTGIDSNHGDLDDNLTSPHKAVVSCRGNPNVCLEAWDDDNGHGTHVSGSAGAEDNDEAVVGVADRISLHAVKVLDSNGSGSFSEVIDGVDFVAKTTSDLGEPTVANMSLGASRDEGDSCGSSNLHQAICNARDVGVVFAVAAGNDGADAGGFVPASYDNAVITQSATGGDGDPDGGVADTFPDWTNWGDDAADWDNDAGQHAPVALAAPGVDVLSTWNDGGTNTISGTSMASPHVAGAAALAIKEFDITATDATAFQDVRSNLLDNDESTDDFTNNTGDPHEEDFVDVRK